MSEWPTIVIRTGKACSVVQKIDGVIACHYCGKPVAADQYVSLTSHNLPLDYRSRVLGENPTTVQFRKAIHYCGQHKQDAENERLAKQIANL